MRVQALSQLGEFSWAGSGEFRPWIFLALNERCRCALQVQRLQAPDCNLAKIVAEHLTVWAKRAHGGRALRELCDKLGHAEKHTIMLMEACAEMCLQSQWDSLHKMLEYVKAMARADAIRPVAFLWKVAHDETPLRCKVAFGEVTNESVQVAKLFVVESSWSMVLEHKVPVEGRRLMVVEGHFSPCLRAADSTNGLAIAAVLRSVAQQQLPKGLPELFQISSRCIECDEAGANARAERFLETDEPRWTRLTINCLCHKVHAAVQKTWSLNLAILTGTVRSLLVMQGSAGLCRLKAKLRDLVAERCELIYTQAPLEPAAMLYRRNILSAYLPAIWQSRRRATALLVTGLFLNGDWRCRHTMQHRCTGCCRDKRHCVAKMQAFTEKLFGAVKASMLCKANWTEWSAPLSVIGLLSGIHSLLPDVVAAAFGSDQEDFQCKGGREGRAQSL